MFGETDEAWDRDARRQGLSDGYYGYPCDPGDWPKRQAEAYRAGWSEGAAKGAAMNRQCRDR